MPADVGEDKASSYISVLVAALPKISQYNVENLTQDFPRQSINVRERNSAILFSTNNNGHITTHIASALDVETSLDMKNMLVPIKVLGRRLS
jgi:hypothetical protein